MNERFMKLLTPLSMRGIVEPLHTLTSHTYFNQGSSTTGMSSPPGRGNTHTLTQGRTNPSIGGTMNIKDPNPRNMEDNIAKHITRDKRPPRKEDPRKKDFIEFGSSETDSPTSFLSWVFWSC